MWKSAIILHHNDALELVLPKTSLFLYLQLSFCAASMLAAHPEEQFLKYHHGNKTN